MADEKDTGFKVTDKRMFNADGTPRETAKSESSHEEPPQQSVDAQKVLEFPGAAAKRQPEPSEQRRKPGTRATLPEPTFASFINVLAVEAAMHLGLLENPVEGRRTVDVESARHMIDTLAMLQEKTRGNLTRQESDLLENILAELRMQFVASSRRQ